MMYREFWENGFRIFGLYAIRNGKCACGHHDCNMAGKHPAAANWQYSPVWSDEQLEAMEQTREFETGYGIVVKEKLVIDIDARNGGVASLERLLNDFPMLDRCGLIVKTGSGNGSRHYYFKLAPGVALRQKHPDYPGIDFKSSGYVVGPGSLHISGNRYEVEYGSPADLVHAPDELIEKLRKPETIRTEFSGAALDVTHDDIAEMLTHVDPDTDHETWIRCGMAIHHATDGLGFDLWNKWSGQGKKYPGRSSLEKRWFSLGKAANPVTLGTLIHYAMEGGYAIPVEFTSDTDFGDIPTPASNEPPKVVIDLTRPPGLVGEVAAWIENTNRRKREHLAVASALFAVGNIAGLRYTDDVDNVTTNLFIFGIAASGSGKEAPQQAVAALHKAAGIHPAQQGSIKSEQEIIRNLTRHQAALYIIDEVGSLLRKIKNAQNSGASYLEGVIGTLMSAYSKASDFMLLTGDMKEEVRGQLIKELRQIEKTMEEHGETPRLLQTFESIQHTLSGLDDGLERPFLSLAGFTTPIDFNDLVDFRMATNGFVRRALIFNERKNDPPLKKKFKKQKMPQQIRMAMAALYTGGEYDLDKPGRVEHYRDRVEIPTTADGVAELERVSDRLEALAEQYKDTSGLEALPLGAYELIAKVSLILAVPEGLRTVEHIQWAEALVHRDIEDKARLVLGNDRAKDDPALALQNRISNLLAGEEGETLGMLVNALRPAKRGAIEAALDRMVKLKMVQIEEYVHKFTKKNVKRYRLSRHN
jgi:hypothetical protein